MFISNDPSIYRRKHFIEKIYHSSDFESMKGNLYKIVTRLVNYKFGKTNGMQGVTKDANDQFYSNLYQF